MQEQEAWLSSCRRLRRGCRHLFVCLGPDSFDAFRHPDRLRQPCRLWVGQNQLQIAALHWLASAGAVAAILSKRLLAESGLSLRTATSLDVNVWRYFYGTVRVVINMHSDVCSMLCMPVCTYVDVNRPTHKYTIYKLQFLICFPIGSLTRVGRSSTSDYVGICC